MPENSQRKSVLCEVCACIFLAKYQRFYRIHTHLYYTYASIEVYLCVRNEEHQVLYEKYRYFISIDKLAVLYYYFVVLPCIYLFIQVDLVSGYVTICCTHTHTHTLPALVSTRARAFKVFTSFSICFFAGTLWFSVWADCYLWLLLDEQFLEKLWRAEVLQVMQGKINVQTALCSLSRDKKLHRILTE